MTKICWMTPRPKHNIFQNRMLYDKMVERGWDFQYNEPDKTTEYLFCTSESQHKITSILAKWYNIPYITWVMDISINPFIMENIQSYVAHIRDSFRVIAIAEKVQWETIKITGRYRVDLLYPCVDDELIEKIPPQERKEQILFLSSLNHFKGAQILFQAWEFLPKKPKLIFAYTSDGLLEEQLKIESARYGDLIQFIENPSDEEKFRLMKESKLFVNPCSYGGFNLPPIEAYMCGTPTLVSDDHSYRTFQSAFFYFRTDDIFDCVKMLIESYDNKSRFDKGSQEIINQFKISECIKRLEAFFNASKIRKVKK